MERPFQKFPQPHPQQEPLSLGKWSSTMAFFWKGKRRESVEGNKVLDPLKILLLNLPKVFEINELIKTSTLNFSG